VAYGIELNLSHEDLGHPDRPGLWEELHGHCRPGVLKCVECLQRDPGCPQYMYVRVSRGRRIACHLNTGIRAHPAAESPRHRALKERIALTAERAGYRARLEDTANDGSRRTDVMVHGTDGLLLGCEVQVSHITPQAVIHRGRIAFQQHIRPLWTVDDTRAAPIDRVPWARIDNLPLEILTARNNRLDVRGGVRTLRMERCDERRVSPCPQRGRGRCGRWHGEWDPLGIALEDMITRAAAQGLVPLYQRRNTGRGGWWMWVSDLDKQEFLAGQPEPLPSYLHTGPDNDDRAAADQQPVPPDPLCHYGEQAGRPIEVPLPRDTGEQIPAATTDRYAATPPAQEIDGFTIPGDLIALRRTFEQADSLLRRLSARMPAAGALLRGEAEPDPEMEGQVEREWERCRRLAVTIHAHPWWATVPNRHRAEQALRQAAHQPT
jgi:hypothetical protein